MFNLSDFKLSDYHWIYPKKDGVKVVLGFDIFKNQVLIWRTTKLNCLDAELQTFPYREKFLSDEFFTELSEILKLYSQTLTSEKQVSAYFVIPDCMVSMDTATLPQMRGKSREMALEGHLNNLYKDIKEYELKRYLVSANKKNLTYVLAVTQQKQLSKIKDVMSENKLSPKFTVFSSSALINCVLHLHPAYRKKSFIFMDIREEYTQIAICYHGRTFGFTRLMLGYKHLSKEDVLQENMLYDHDVANLAILNAQEKAQMKKLTVSNNAAGDLEAVADDVIHQLEQGINLNRKEQSRGLKYASAFLGGTDEEQEDEEEPIEEEPEDEEQEPEEETGPKQKVFTRKSPRRLPKYMFRPEPTDERGFVYENFRMFTKWAMLYYKWLKDLEYLQDFDFVLVNLPEKYSYLIERANSEEEKSLLPYELLEKSADTQVPSEPDLFGALYAGVYNKRFDF